MIDKDVRRVEKSEAVEKEVKSEKKPGEGEMNEEDAGREEEPEKSGQ
jgi:hypothetical protein